MVNKPGFKFDFRDVSSGIQKLREFLLGRKYVQHNRFPPLIAPRSIPPPDVPRGPEQTNRYSDMYYTNRDVLGSVKPPVVAPIAEGLRGGDGKLKIDRKKMDTRKLLFECPPTPGCTWWWDAHCYYKDICPTPPPCPPFAPPSPSTASPCDSQPSLPPSSPPVPCKSEQSEDPCAQTPVCKLPPCEIEKPPPPPPPPPFCDPCDPKHKK
ncbi:formin-like protein 14 [Spodoptera litura]|uniref:Formin-like protein 14 n=1 Tax=Spodoptera litura TaxID=69820 RepID=A0A9J7IT01_SPOLT|nr:formin-like protein 14 [Spodoptera litura]